MPEIPGPLQEEDFRFIKVKENSKRPFENNWQNQANYRYNDPEIQQHLENGENYGVVGGYGDLVIIDADQEKVENAIEANLPETLKIRSGGGGAHFYYISPDLEDPIRLKDNQAGDLGDVQGKGKQAVGPTCNHPTGGKYEIENKEEIAEIEASEIKYALRKFINTNNIKEESEKEKLEKEYDQDIDLSISNVCSVAGLDKRGQEFYGEHPVHGSNTGKNFWLNTRKNTWHCFRHNTGGGPMSWIAVKEGIISCAEATPGALQGDKFKKTLEIAREDYGLPDPKKEFKEKIESPVDMEWEQVIQLFEDSNTDKLSAVKGTADYLLTQYNFKTTEDNEQLWVFDKQENIYKPEGKQIVKKEVENNLKKYVRRRDIEEVIESIKNRTFTSRPHGSENPEYIAVENGWLNLKKRELEKPNPDLFITTKIPVKYDKEAGCPNIKEFVSEIVEDENIPILQELAGYTLYRDYPIAKAFMLLGDGKNGKSTFLNLLQGFIGQKNIATPSLHQLVNNRFAKSELYGKLANIHGDLSSKTLNQTGPFKMLTGQDLIRGEKKYQDSFVFKNHAKLIYSSNELPRSKDTTDAFFRRWIIVNFPYKFTEDPEDSHKDKDSSLPESIMTDEEMSGMLNWALDGLHRLWEQNHFTKTGAMEEIKQEWLTQTNPLKVFVDKFVEVDRGSFVTKDEFHTAYVEFCEEHNAPSLDKNVIGRKLPTMIPQVDTFKPQVDGKQTNSWKNITFKDSVTEEEYIKDIEDKNVPSRTREENSNNDIEKGVQKNLDIPDMDDGDSGFESASLKKLSDTDYLKKLIDQNTEVGNKQIEIETLVEQSCLDESRTENILGVLESDGFVYRPRPGVVEKL